MSKASDFYSKYRYNVYPYVSHIRGSWRISRKLRELAARGLPKVQSESASGIFNYQWDNLVIFDACRRDLWEEAFGEVESRTSLGSNTREFIEKTFSSEDLSDIVIVAANPQYADSRLENRIGNPNPFHAKYDVYDTDWDHDLGTVRPEKVTQKILGAKKLFPDKKIIGHYLQPHYPFIGGEIDLDDVESFNEDDSVWNKAERGQISREEAWDDYRKNLKLLKDTIDELKNLEGETLLTSDHGNFVGENNLYGHPGRMKYKPLREVPITRI